jgi:hypothetical protein
MHPKFHIRFACGLPVNNEHAIVAIIRDSVLLDNIAQGKYVGDGLLVKPYISRITSHFCLVFDRHGTTIAFQLHLCAGSEDLLHEVRVADQIHGRLAVYENDLPQIQRHVATMCLFEQLGYSWFELAFHLCELKFVSGGLEVRLPLEGVRLRDVGIFFGLFELRERFLHTLYFLLQFLDTFCLAGTRLRVVLVVTIRPVCR